MWWGRGLKIWGWCDDGDSLVKCAGNEVGLGQGNGKGAGHAVWGGMGMISVPGQLSNTKLKLRNIMHGHHSKNRTANREFCNALSCAF